MSGHTPGPWGIIVGDAGPIVFSGAKSNMVAHCIKAWSSEERMANARLIAASPDLLEALHFVLTQFEIVLPSSGLTHDERQSIIKARAAIAKATGETK